MRRSALALLAILLCHLTSPLPRSSRAIPPDLKPWESWVMYGEEFRRCPVRNGVAAEEAAAFVCAWPGRMHVAVSSGGGEFRQSWRIYADSWVALPGDSEHWPEDVRVDGTPRRPSSAAACRSYASVRAITRSAAASRGRAGPNRCSLRRRRRWSI